MLVGALLQSDGSAVRVVCVFLQSTYLTMACRFAGETDAYDVLRRVGAAETTNRSALQQKVGGRYRRKAVRDGRTTVRILRYKSPRLQIGTGVEQQFSLPILGDRQRPSWHLSIGSDGAEVPAKTRPCRATEYSVVFGCRCPVSPCRPVVSLSWGCWKPGNNTIAIPASGPSGGGPSGGGPRLVGSWRLPIA